MHLYPFVARIRSVMLLFILPFLLWVHTAPAGEPAISPPVGRGGVGGVRFDAVMELDFHAVGMKVALFARYWVSSDSYHVAVLWAEPHWQPINYSAYPVSLSVDSRGKAFVIKNTVRREQSDFARPTGERGPFDYAYGQYPITELKYLESEVQATSIRFSDLSAAGGTGPLMEYAIGKEGLLAKVTLVTTGSLVRQLKLQGNNEYANKTIDYHYDPASPGDLAETVAVLKAWPIQIGKAVPMSLEDQRGKKSILTDKLLYHGGGRECRVKYAKFVLNGQSVMLPVQCDVVTADSMKTPLRRFVLSDYQSYDPKTRPWETAGGLLGDFTQDELKWRDLLIRYWLAEPGSIDSSDRKALSALRGRFLTQLTTDRGPGETLKHLHMVAMIEIMLDNRAGLVALFPKYLEQFDHEGLEAMTLSSGLDLLTLLRRWQKTDWAGDIIPLWAQCAVVRNPREDVLAYILEAKENAHFWLAYHLAKALQKNQSSDVHENLVIHALAAKLVYKVIASASGAGQEGEAGSLYNLGILRQSGVDVPGFLKQEVAAAKQVYARIKSPTDEDTTIDRMLDQYLEAIGGK